VKVGKTKLSNAPIISLFLIYLHYLFVKNWKVGGAALSKIQYKVFLNVDILPFLFSVMFSFSPYLFFDLYTTYG